MLQLVPPLIVFFALVIPAAEVVSEGIGGASLGLPPSLSPLPLTLPLPYPVSVYGEKGGGEE